MEKIHDRETLEFLECFRYNEFSCGPKGYAAYEARSYERTGGNAMSFLLCIAQYLLIMVFILAVGALGAFIGITLRKRKNAKELANETESQDRN